MLSILMLSVGICVGALGHASNLQVASPGKIGLRQKKSSFLAGLTCTEQKYVTLEV